jgi:LppP/LprE lipoprotein
VVGATGAGASLARIAPRAALLRPSIAFAAAVIAAATVAGCGGGETATSTGGEASGDAAANAAPPPLSRALAVVRERGYFPTDTSAYDPRNSPAVLLGVRRGSADGTAQRAFFFAAGRFVGPDTPDDSAGIRIDSARPPVIALTYQLFNPRDPQCCATAGTTTVRYRWDGRRVAPLGPIPPSSISARGSRR